MKYFITTLTLLFSISLSAQFRLNINGGISNNLKSNSDITSLAAKNGTSLGLKPAYSFGRIAIAASINSTKHGAINGTEFNERLKLDTSFKIASVSETGVGSTSVFIGPELCICFKKIKIIPSVKAGVVSTKTNGYNIDVIRTNGLGFLYQLQTQTNTDFGTQTGLQLGYKVNKHISIGLLTELTNYTTSTIIRDTRTATTQASKEQKYSFLKTGVGFTYNFY